VGIIALSLLEGNAYRQAAMAAGADDLVRKGELTTDLLPAIRRVTRASAWCHCQRGENPGWQLHLVAPTPFLSGWTAADSRTPARVSSGASSTMRRRVSTISSRTCHSCRWARGRATSERCIATGEAIPVAVASPRHGKPVPTVLTQQEVLDVIECLSDTYRLPPQLLYGSGLRLMECMRLRVGDLDLPDRRIVG